MTTTKIYIEKRTRDGELKLVEFPRGSAGKKMWDKLLSLKRKGRLKI